MISKCTYIFQKGSKKCKKYSHAFVGDYFCLRIHTQVFGASECFGERDAVCVNNK